MNIIQEQAEMSTDVAAYDKAKRRLALGEEELVPAKIVDRLLSGENPVRVWREHRGLSARDLTEAAKIASPDLSQIEMGRREGIIAMMKKIAHALNLTLEDLVW